MHEPGEGPPLAIVAGRGPLPRLIAQRCQSLGRPYRVVVFGSDRLDWLDGHPVIEASFEKPGRMFANLRAVGCTQATFAGGMDRPALNPMRFDLTMMRLAPRLLAGLRRGDDSLLRLVAEVFEGEGFAVVAPHTLVGDVVVEAGILTRLTPSAQDRADATRAAEIVAAIGAADLGQGAVVAQGVCLGVETIQGTDAMLDFVARTAAAHRPDPSGARGVLYKAPKPGQDTRLDLPAVGPATVAGAARAGLAGIALKAGGVMIFEREAAIAAADDAGLFLWGREG